MKRISLFFALLLTSFLGYSQTKGINYQAVIIDPNPIEIPGKDVAAQPYVNKEVWLRFTISQDGVSQYQEIQKTKTDEYGLVNLIIGTGINSGKGGTFASLSWEGNVKNIMTEVSFNKGSKYVEVGNQKLNYVPYSLFTETANKLAGVLPISAGGTGGITSSAAKANLGLDKVDNTSDLAKPVSTATLAILDTKESLSNKSTNIEADSASLVKYPSVKAIKDYIDNRNSATASNARLAAKASALETPRTINGIPFDGTANITIPVGVTPPDADASTKGLVQLAGDLSGTAASPAIAAGAVTTTKITDGAVTDAKIATVSGSKVTGNITGNAANVTGTVAIANGGTGATTAAGARTNLGLVIGTDVLAQRSFGTAANSAATDFIPVTEKAANNGVATLGNDGKIPSVQIPAISFQNVSVVNSASAMTSIAGAQVGSIAIRTDNNNNYVLSALPASTLSNWIALATPIYVSTVNGFAGPNVVLTTNDVAEGNNNKYYTDARVRGAISATGPLSYNASTGNFSMTAASGSANGYLSSADWTTFNNKQTALTAGVDYATPSGNITGNAANVTGVVSIANGGTGTSTASGALLTLGAEPSANKSNDILVDGNSTTKFPTFKAIKDYVDQQSANAGVADNSITSAKINGSLAVLKGGTGATTAAGARTNLGLVIGTDVMAANFTTTLTGDVTGSGNGSFATTVNSVGGVSSATISTLPTSVSANTASITANTSAIAANTTSITANTAAILLKAPIASPTFTGTPSAPTPAISDNSTTLATTEYVKSNLATVSAGTLTGTTLASTITGSSLTSVGTITSGVWSGTAISNDKLANSTTILGSTTLTLGGTVTSVTGLTSLAATNLTGTLSGTATTATNLDGGVAGSIPYQTGAGTTAMIPVGSANQFLTSVAGGTYTWTSASAVTGNYVPYTGANASLNLGANDIFADNAKFTGDLYTVPPAVTTAYNNNSYKDNNGLVIHSYNQTGAGSFVNFVATGKNNGNWNSNITFLTRGSVATDNPVERLRITKDGRIGIGTTSPTTTLDVAGSANISGGLSVSGTISSATWSGTVIGNNFGGAGTTNGILKANGSGVVSAAVAGTDFQAPLTAGSGISIVSGTISATDLTTANLSSNAGITNAQLANSSTTLGSTTMTLGGTVTSVTGLTSLAATNLTGTLSGTATSLATGRTIALTGDVTYTSPAFDGSGNVTAAATLANSGVASGTYGSSTAIPVLTVDTKGRVTSASTVGIIAGVNSLNYTSTTSYAAGGTISGTALTLTAADGTNPGLISTGAQTIAGAKTFSNDLTAPNFIGNVTGTVTGNLSGTANTATNLAGGVSGSIPFQTAAGVTSMIPTGQANQILTSTGSGTYTWTSVTNVTGNSVPYTGATGAVNLGAYDLTVNGLTVGTGVNGSTLSNTAFGVSALASNNSGLGKNTALGYFALNKNTSGQGNTAVGYNTSLNQTSSLGNTAIGSSALEKNIANGNTAVGNGAGYGLDNNTFYYNSFLGYGAGGKARGAYNVGIGNLALEMRNSGTNTGADRNVAIGNNAMTLSSKPIANVVIGDYAGYNISNGSYNVILGQQSGYDMTAGYHNTILGDSTGLGITTGSRNTIIGAKVTGLSPTLTGNIILADGAGNIRAQHDGTGWSLGTISSGVWSGTAIANNKLANSSTILGSTTMTLGGTVTSVTGLTSLAATNLTGTLSGTATSLATGRTIALTGDVTYTSPAFDGSGNVTAAATLAASGVASGTYGSSTAIPVLTLDTKGRVTSASTVGIIAGVNSLNYTSTTSYAAGGTISGTSLTLAAADGTNPGLISTGAQTIAGAKTFNADVTAPNFLGNATTATTAGNITATSNTTLTSLANLATVGTITTGTWSATEVAIAKGGTGATTASGARTNLGLTIGTDVMAANFTTTLTGDVTGAGNGSFATTLAASGVASGTYGSSTTIPVLTVDTKGRITTASTVSIVAGVNTVTAIDATSNANGATISGTALTLTPADASNGGVVTTGAQTFAGVKTFSSAVTASSNLARGTIFSPTLTAAANNDILVGVDINPTFTNGSFTPVANYGLRVQGIHFGRGGGNIANNTALGTDALKKNSSSGGSNTAFGWASLAGNTDGGNNTAVGKSSLGSNATGSDNTAVGAIALTNNTAGNNTAVGSNSLNANTSGTQNTSVGSYALSSNTTGNYNVSIGGNANNTNQTGSNNIAIGYQSLYANSVKNSTSDNVAIGYQSMGNSPSGSSNTVIGTQSNYSNTTGANNTALGWKALYYNATGTNNTALGYYAGNTTTTNVLTNGIYLGYYAAPKAATSTDEIVIGSNLTGNGSNTITIGNASNTANYLRGILNINAGTATATTNGLSTVLTAQNAGTGNQNGGNITLTPGTATGTGTAGIVQINGQIQITGGSPAAGEVLTSDANGLATWAVPTGVSSIGAISGTATSTGATITSGVLNLTPADATNGGVVNTTSQTFAGSKTFSSDISVNTVKVGKGSGTGTGNTALGTSTLNANTTGNYNTMVGGNSGVSNTTGSGNVSLGYSSLNSNTTGSNNISIGNAAMNGMNTYNYNVGIGQQALRYVKGNYNVAIGDGAGANLGSAATTGTDNNIMIGASAGYQAGLSGSNTAGKYSIFIGYDTRPAADAETNEIVISGYDGSAGTIGLGSNSTLIGNSATTQAKIFGALTLPSTRASTSTTTGALIVSGGAGIAGNLNVGGTLTIGGANAVLTTGAQTVAGVKTFSSNIISNGISLGTKGGSSNVLVGSNVMTTTTTSDYNTSVGTYSMNQNTTGNNNVAMGYAALYNNAAGTDHVSIGASTLNQLTSGNYNIAVGSSALHDLTAASNNTALGYNAGATLTTGGGNTYLGTQAGQFIGSASVSNLTGSNSTLVGYNTSPLANGDANEVVLAGYNGSSRTVGLGSNTTLIGNSATTLTQLMGAVNIPSTSASTSTTTGALRVAGGAGIAGALNVGGNAKITGTIEIDGGSPGAGKVLVSDANGVASWSSITNGGVSSITASATMAATDNYNVIIFSGSTASQTITLPSAVTVGAGREITIKNIASVSVGVAATAGNLISDSTTTAATSLSIGIEPSNNWIRAISNGTNWIILRGLF